MAIQTHSIEIETRAEGDIQDITPAAARIIEESGLRSGTVTLFCPGSTGGITTLEFESGVVQDMNRLFEELAPANQDYQHHLKWGDDNGRSHIRAGLLGPSLTVPFVDANLTLGTWQQIVFVEFDTRPRSRKLVVQVLGE